MSEPVSNHDNLIPSADSESCEPVSSAFGQDSNSYAYPSAQGLSGYGISSIVCALLGFFCLLPAFVGLGLGIAGLIRRRSDVLCWIGLVLSVMFLIYGVITAVQLCASPQMQELMSSVI